MSTSPPLALRGLSVSEPATLSGQVYYSYVAPKAFDLVHKCVVRTWCMFTPTKIESC